MNTWTSQIKNMFTAMAFAEAGDLDAVKQILREEDQPNKPELDRERASTQPPAVPAT